jgi:hypothetical protein
MHKNEREEIDENDWPNQTVIEEAVQNMLNLEEMKCHLKKEFQAIGNIRQYMTGCTGIRPACKQSKTVYKPQSKS